MKIENSMVNLASQHYSVRQNSVEESLRAWVGQQRPDFEGRNSNNLSPQSTIATISAAGNQAACHAKSCVEAAPEASIGSTDPKILFLIGLVEAMTGHKIKLFSASDLVQPDSAEAVPAETAAEVSQNTESKRHGWGVEYDKREIIYEAEKTSFAAQGIVKTADGKEIQFKLSLNMQREFYQETNESIRQGDGVKKDPLVINFNGTAARLTDTKFSFDLNSDGKAESMAFVASGSGFLALDKNANGVIDNGTELFGAQSGDGFADLAAYDSDGNHWIDESDPIFSKLLVWSKADDGADNLSPITQQKVGALYLGNVTSAFDLKNAVHDLQGQIRSSGIYLNENGSAGTLQQVDLVV